jgi:hypothetical protein
MPSISSAGHPWNVERVMVSLTPGENGRSRYLRKRPVRVERYSSITAVASFIPWIQARTRGERMPSRL